MRALIYGGLAATAVAIGSVALNLGGGGGCPGGGCPLSGSPCGGGACLSRGPAETPAAVPLANVAGQPGAFVSAEATEDPAVVPLPSDKLVAGIPGSGPLKIAEINAWLADPNNHVELKVELPLGLDEGQDDLVIPADNPLTRAKIELGRQLYFDKRLSHDNTISCASCHAPSMGYAQHTKTGVGIRNQKGGRNSPTAANRILSKEQFWDGRAASLEAQAVGPIANPIEMGMTHDACIARLREIDGYVVQFEKVFGGDDPLNIDHVGKALAAFERVIVSGPSPYDYYHQLKEYTDMGKENVAALKESDPAAYARFQEALAGAKAKPLNESARRGYALYFSDKTLCAECHGGPNLTDEKYHNLGVGMDAEKPDLGRYEVTKKEKDKGAFKTPTVRNIAQTAPYMHDGSVATLEEVIAWYDQGGHPNDHLSDLIFELGLSEQDEQDLVEFMKACSGRFPKVEEGRLPE